MTTPCPICGNLLYVRRDTPDGHTLLEEWFDCIYCKYGYTYAYGVTQILIGDEEFSIGYSASAAQFRDFNRQVENAIKDQKAYNAQNPQTRLLRI